MSNKCPTKIFDSATAGHSKLMSCLPFVAFEPKFDTESTAATWEITIVDIVVCSNGMHTYKAGWR